MSATATTISVAKIAIVSAEMVISVAETAFLVTGTPVSAAGTAVHLAWPTTRWTKNAGAAPRSVAHRAARRGAPWRAAPRLVRDEYSNRAENFKWPKNREDSSDLH